MAAKDVIGRGIGPSTSISFFITGGFLAGVVDPGTAITNSGTYTAENNVEHCARSGFRLMACDGPVRDGHTNHWVRKKSHDNRHPQDMVRSVDVGVKGSPSPEPADRWLEVNEITKDSF